MFGLPGNPVSSLVSFELFARPALRQMAGHRRLARPSVVAIADADLARRPDGNARDARRTVSTATTAGCTSCRCRPKAATSSPPPPTQPWPSSPTATRSLPAPRSPRCCWRELAGSPCPDLPPAPPPHGVRRVCSGRGGCVPRQPGASAWSTVCSGGGGCVTSVGCRGSRWRYSRYPGDFMPGTVAVVCRRRVWDGSTRAVSRRSGTSSGEGGRS